MDELLSFVKKESNQRNSPHIAHTACAFVIHDEFGRCGTRHRQHGSDSPRGKLLTHHALLSELKWAGKSNPHRIELLINPIERAEIQTWLRGNSASMSERVLFTSELRSTRADCLYWGYPRVLYGDEWSGRVFWVTFFARAKKVTCASRRAINVAE